MMATGTGGTVTRGVPIHGTAAVREPRRCIILNIIIIIITATRIDRMKIRYRSQIIMIRIMNVIHMGGVVDGRRRCCGSDSSRIREWERTVAIQK